MKRRQELTVAQTSGVATDGKKGVGLSNESEGGGLKAGPED